MEAVTSTRGRPAAIGGTSGLRPGPHGGLRPLRPRPGALPLDPARGGAPRPRNLSREDARQVPCGLWARVARERGDCWACWGAVRGALNALNALNPGSAVFRTAPHHARKAPGSPQAVQVVQVVRADMGSGAKPRTSPGQRGGVHSSIGGGRAENRGQVRKRRPAHHAAQARGGEAQGHRGYGEGLTRAPAPALPQVASQRSKANSVHSCLRQSRRPWRCSSTRRVTAAG